MRSVAVAVLVWLAPVVDAVTTTSACLWPDCGPRCLPCDNPNGIVSSCLIFGCAASHGPTDCINSKCACKTGYCADATNSRCEPQVCLPGSHPWNFTPSGWVYTFNSMASGAKFPGYESLKENPMPFVMNVSTVPVLFLVLSILVSVATCLCIDCRPPEGVDDGDGTDSRELSTSLSSKKKEPWVRPLIGIAAVIIVLNIIAWSLRHANFERTEYIMDDALYRALNNTKMVSKACTVVNGTVSNLYGQLEVLLPTCNDGLAKPIVDKLSGDLMGTLKGYIDMAGGYIVLVVSIPSDIDRVNDLWNQYKWLLVWVPLVPILVPTLICLLSLAETLVVRYMQKEFWTRILAENIRIFAWGLGFVVLVVGALICVETVILITLSKFCLDPDSNVVSYVNATTSNISGQIGEIADSYIQGSPGNPIKNYYDMALGIIAKVDAIYAEIQPALGLLGSLCPAIPQLNIPNVTGTAKNVLGHARGLLKNQNIWPYYRHVVRQGICGQVISSVSQMWVMQLLVCLMLFPLWAVLTGRYLQDLDAFERKEEEEEEDGGKSEESD